MNNLEKFADYGLTGTFFLFTQAAFLALRGFGVEDGLRVLALWVPRSDESLGYLAPVMKELVPQLLTIGGVAAVFFFGLLLDLLGNLLVVTELRVFRHHLERHQGWIRPLARRSRAAVRDDVRCFLTGGRSAFFRGPRHYCTLFRDTLPAFRRLWALLIAYISTFCPVQEPQALGDNVRLWRVARAVSTTLLIVALELLLPCLWRQEWESASWRHRFIWGLAMVPLAWSLNYAAYNRLCACLFSFGLTTYASQTSTDP